jgi:S-adenosyl methyltransferase
VPDSPQLDPARPTPATRTEVIENRAFLRRAVRHLASRGITQYLDLGSGYPAAGAVHRTAAELIASPRVVYVDNDPRVAETSRGLLASPDTAVIVRDVRRPAEIIDDPQTRRLIDWSRPPALWFSS